MFPAPAPSAEPRLSGGFFSNMFGFGGAEAAPVGAAPSGSMPILERSHSSAERVLGEIGAAAEADEGLREGSTTPRIDVRERRKSSAVI